MQIDRAMRLTQPDPALHRHRRRVTMRRRKEPGRKRSRSGPAACSGSTSRQRDHYRRLRLRRGNREPQPRLPPMHCCSNARALERRQLRRPRRHTPKELQQRRSILPRHSCHPHAPPAAPGCDKHRRRSHRRRLRTTRRNPCSRPSRLNRPWLGPSDVHQRMRCEIQRRGLEHSSFACHLLQHYLHPVDREQREGK